MFTCMLIDHNILSTQITYLQKNTHVFDSSVKEEGRGGWVSGHHRSQNADSVLYSYDAVLRKNDVTPLSCLNIMCFPHL